MDSNIAIWSDDGDIAWSSLAGEVPALRGTTTLSYLAMLPDLTSQRREKKHVESLEVVILCVLVLRGILVFSRILAILVHAFRQFIRCLKRISRRFSRWRDRLWRRPRYILRCDLSALEPGACPVCLAPLAGEPSESQCIDLTTSHQDEHSEHQDASVLRPATVTEAPEAIELQISGEQPGGTTMAEPLFRLRCGHTFHAACINEWLDRGDTCPLCRADVGDLRDCVQMLNLSSVPLTAPPVRRQVRELASSLFTPFQARHVARTSSQDVEPMLETREATQTSANQSELQNLTSDAVPV